MDLQAYLSLYGNHIAARGMDTLEVPAVCIEIKDAKSTLLSSPRFNPAQGVADLISVLIGSNRSNFRQAWNLSNKDATVKGNELQSPFGMRMGFGPRLDRNISSWYRNRLYNTNNQIKNAIRLLRGDPGTRRAIVQIWDNSIDQIIGGYPPSAICFQLLIREGCLDLHLYMRSNELYYGFPLDVYIFSSIQQIIAGWIDLEVGKYVHFASSLHVYETEINKSESLYTDRNIISRVKIGEWGKVMSIVARIVYILSGSDVSIEEITYAISSAQNLPPSYRDWIRCLAAERMFRSGRTDASFELAASSSGPLLGAWLEAVQHE